MLELSICEDYYKNNQARFIQEWSDFIRYKSVSTDQAFKQECVACASWVNDKLNDIGLKSEIVQTPGNPIVLAKGPETPGKPRVLLYGHYDVQPADPYDAWKSDPFKADLRDGRLYARGAHDNKGQLWALIKAAEFLIKENALKCQLTVIVDGEEESGSGGLFAILPDLAPRIQAETLYSCDGEALRVGVPSVVLGLRGVVALEVRLFGIRNDLHSGIFGGVVKNPATEMARLLATLHRRNGSIAIEGYYDQVAEPSAEIKALINQNAVSKKAFKASIGVAPTGGERGFTPSERTGLRPTVEVCGLHSGYGGSGMKNIIPSEAIAKISSRIVPGQDPKHCRELLEAHLTKHAPKDLQLEIKNRESNEGALSISPQALVIGIAKQAAQAACGGNIDMLWSGASIPVANAICRHSGAQPLLLGLALEEDNMHGPNESFLLSQFKLGFLYTTVLLQQIGS